MSSLATSTAARALLLPQPKLTPPFVAPSTEPLGRLGFVTRFVRNPLLVVPEAAYREDIVSQNEQVHWVSSPDLIKTMLLDQRDTFQKIVQIRLLSPLLGRGIITSEGNDWKWQRQASAPMFRHQDLMTFVPTFVDATEAILAHWRKTAPGTVHDVNADMTRLTFDVISRTILPTGDANMTSAVESSTEAFQKGGAWSQLYAFLRMPHWVPQPRRGAQKQAITMLRGTVHKMIAERRALATPPDDLMTRLMRAQAPETGAPMTDEQLVDNLLSFYLAGHETTAKALTWTLYLLSQAPEWADAIAQEVTAVAGDAPISAATIDKLALTQQVVKESMRLFPPVPMLSRQAVKDTTLGGQSIKAGASLIVSMYALQRHTRHWEHPHLFDPTRFAPEKERNISRYVYMPFGAGPRICIGMSFAILEATAMLATMVRAMTFTNTGSEPKPIARVTLFPQGGMPLAVAPRAPLGRTA